MERSQRQERLPNSTSPRRPGAVAWQRGVGGADYLQIHGHWLRQHLVLAHLVQVVQPQQDTVEVSLRLPRTAWGRRKVTVRAPLVPCPSHTHSNSHPHAPGGSGPGLPRWARKPRLRAEDTQPLYPGEDPPQAQRL